jgi:hypothetical protein
MQLGQVLPYVDCANSLRISAMVSFALGLLAVAAAVVSWRSRNSVGDAPPSPSSGVPWQFVATVGTLAALLFAFTMVLQGASSLVLTGCER